MGVDSSQGHPQGHGELVARKGTGMGCPLCTHKLASPALGLGEGRVRSSCKWGGG